MNVVVTGAVGFIAHNLCKELTKQGYDVYGVDNLSGGYSQFEKTKQHVKDLFIIDFTDERQVEKFFRSIPQIDTVFHVGALPRVQFSIQHPITTHRSNTTGTIVLLEQSIKNNVRRLVFSSSSSVYGNQDTLPLKENMIPNPMSPYALHKLTGEYYCKLYYDIHGLETISLRYFNVYGGNQSPDSDYAAAIPKFTRQIRHGEKPTVYGDGEQSRDFSFVDDVVDINIKASQTTNEDALGEVFNVGYGEQTTVNELITLILDYYRSNLEPVYLDPVIEARHTRADISKARRLLGWEPQNDITSGLAVTLQEFDHRNI